MGARGSEAVRLALPPWDVHSDDELMRLASAGQRAAYEALVRRHQARLRAYCARWCGSAVAGDDLAQECFVEVWERRSGYVAQGKFKSYLFQIAANRCKNQVRSEQRARAATDAGGAHVHAEPPGSDRFAIAQRQERLQHGLSKLSDVQREAVLLRYSAELDYGEIASLLGVPEPTLRSRVFLGLIKLRRLLRVEQTR
jgi:RNA polymerase sigma-70 factor (ECF subfamily)